MRVSSYLSNFFHRAVDNHIKHLMFYAVVIIQTLFFLLFCFLILNPKKMQVLKESFKIYCAINDGIINLVDMVKLLFKFVISSWIN
jgi:hypothetical protein